jgi:cell wall-associated NlpC family hydrolase
MSDLLAVTVPVATVWTSPEAPRDIDEAAVRDRPDAAAWADSMGAELRLGLHGRTETQLLMGETVQVLEQRDGWSHVAATAQRSTRDGRGYPGWVRTAHLGEPVGRGEVATVSVGTRTAPCRVEGEASVVLSFATRLCLEAITDETVTVALPGGRLGMLERSTVRLPDPAGTPSRDAVLDAARQFLGVRYLWGGTSAWGLDCSGLVHLCWRSQGVLLPRDAHDQAASHDDVAPVPLDEVRPGDLYFFARPGERIYHVGLVTRPVAADGTRWMLHAPEGGELIEEAPLAPHRVETLVSAGRVLGR